MSFEGNYLCVRVVCSITVERITVRRPQRTGYVQQRDAYTLYNLRERKG